jgi:hypothetical protein
MSTLGQGFELWGGIAFDKTRYEILVDRNRCKVPPCQPLRIKVADSPDGP